MPTASRFCLLMQWISPSWSFLLSFSLCNHFPGEKRFYEVIVNDIYPVKSLTEGCKKTMCKTAKTVSKNSQKSNGGQPLLFKYIFIYLHLCECLQYCCALHCFAYLEKDETLKWTLNYKTHIRFGYNVKLSTPIVITSKIYNTIVTWSCWVHRAILYISRQDHYFLESLSRLFHSMITSLHVNFFGVYCRYCFKTYKGTCYQVELTDERWDL
jgi:hypothetical protein